MVLRIEESWSLRDTVEVRAREMGRPGAGERIGQNIIRRSYRSRPPPGTLTTASGT